MSWERGTDDNEWNDPPGVDLGADDDEADSEEPGALNVATEGESFVDGDDREPLTPGDVSPENALFVALGVAVMLFVLLQLFI